MSCFCLLADPGDYVAHDWDLAGADHERDHWLSLFQKHFVETMSHARQQYGPGAARQIAAATEAFNSKINRLTAKPDALGKLDIMSLCRLRQQTLYDFKLYDPFKNIKQREDNSAVALYPTVVRALHKLDAPQRWARLIRCVFAGNIFDLGATATMKMATESPDFLAILEQTKPRPWLVDDYDALAAKLASAPPTPWAKAVIFVDNCGPDFILGVMPLARELALGGTAIVLAANERPSLNDITADETVGVVESLVAVDNDLHALIEAGMFEVVSTGNDLPLLDLSNVADELNDASADADLVILEGMGRSVESNFDAAFTVDCLRLALLKDPAVAGRIGGSVYDCVCKFTPVNHG